MLKKYTLPGGTEYAGYLTTYAPYLIDTIDGNHVFIAGTTGAGKSTLENSIIKSLLSCKFPGSDDNGRNAKIILLDPKRVELRLYKNLPHTIIYADTIDSIVNALYNIKDIINDRLNVMIKQGRRKSAETPIYIFIDEIINLIESKRGKEIIRLISDTISISRACNVFYIISTQNPARDKIPASVQLNCNCRIALRCNSPIESKMIIGDASALELPKHGRAIVVKDLERYQIAVPLYSDIELQYIVRSWTDQKSILNRFTGLLRR